MRELITDIENAMRVAGPMADRQSDPVDRVRGAARHTLSQRFYDCVTPVARANGFGVTLDGRPLRTPARHLLEVPTARLARALSAEWDAQRPAIDPGALPLTRIVATAIDAVAPHAAAVADEVAHYAAMDALLYRADGPEQLVALQCRHWDPPLAWARTRFGRSFRLAMGVMAVEQDPALITAFRREIETLEPLRLTALHVVTTLTGSAVLALAVAHAAFDPDTVWAAGHVDEDWNVTQWGEDAEAARRRSQRRREFDTATLTLAETGPTSSMDTTV